MHSKPTVNGVLRGMAYALLKVAVLFGVFYLAGAFVSASFNIAEWGEQARVAVVYFSLGLGFPVAIATFGDEK